MCVCAHTRDCVAGLLLGKAKMAGNPLGQKGRQTDRQADTLTHTQRHSCKFKTTSKSDRKAVDQECDGCSKHNGNANSWKCKRLGTTNTHTNTNKPTHKHKHKHTNTHTHKINKTNKQTCMHAW